MLYRTPLVCCLTLLCATSALIVAAAPPSTAPIAGIRDHTPNVHALTGARLVLEPGKVIEKGTIVLRDGVIEAAGADIKPPADARIWDATGKTIYAGFIDAFTEANIDAAALQKGSPHWNKLVTPQLSVANALALDADAHKQFRSQGIAARLVAPRNGILKGSSALLGTGDGPAPQQLIRQDAALHIRLTLPFAHDRQEYPTSPMGAVALARQAFYDAHWYTQANRAADANPQLERPEANDALAALAEFQSGRGLAIFDCNNEQFIFRAEQFIREFGLRAAFRGSGREYRRLKEIQQLGRPLIVPVNFPTAPYVGTPEASDEATLEELLHWDLAPDNPRRLVEAGATVALTTHGLKERTTFLAAIRRAVKRGLSAEQALAALTTTPAQILGVSDKLGKLQRGQLANIVVADGDLFQTKQAKVVETWVLGRRYEVESAPTIDVRGVWELRWTENSGEKQAVLEIAGEAHEPKATIRLQPKPDKEKDPVKFKAFFLRDTRVSGTVEGKSLGHDGIARFNALVLSTADGGLQWTGELAFADGVAVNHAAKRTASHQAKQEDKEDKEDSKKDKSEAEEKPALYAVNYPLGDFGWQTSPPQAAAILFKNATIWTSGIAGTIKNGSLLIGKGKVLAVGEEIKAPADAVVIDCEGKHLSPGIIDCHSHMATDGGINEVGQAITCEVRVADFIDANDVSIYRQLAGGVTSSNILHGSANPIGGQNQVIKLRWGLVPEELKFAEAPGGVKFALGENVKQSNWARPTNRYPQSRMGVEQIIRDELSAGRDYLRRLEVYAQDKSGLPVRKDLELDAIAEVLTGKRWIHCHSYRQDEILSLLRVCESFKVRIGTLQHVLEGYKVADAIARHGAGGSSFSDWWAYKFEVIDSIPFNGALMHRAGVVVSFNSDDRELARHLNQEAAKAMKYGNVPADEALKFVTLNPAKQLRIDQYVGSLEVGKHADLVVWSGSPLSNLSRCEQTWVDGRKYFDRETDRVMREEQQKMRVALVRKILDSGVPTRKAGELDLAEEDLWPREDLFCHHGDEHEGH